MFNSYLFVYFDKYLNTWVFMDVFDPGFSSSFIAHVNLVNEVELYRVGPVLQERYGYIISDVEVNKRVKLYCNNLLRALSLHIENTVNEGKRDLTLRGVLTQSLQSHPFDLFIPIMTTFVNNLVPGVNFDCQINGEAKLLSEFMIYSSLHLSNLPSSVAITTGMSPAAIKQELSRGGVTSGYFRYPQIYSDIFNRSAHLADNLQLLLVGAGLEDGHNGSQTSPQFIEARVLLSGMGKNKSCVTVIDNNPEVIKVVNGPKSYGIMTSGNQPSFEPFFHINSFVNWDGYRTMCAALVKGFGTARNIQTNSIQADLETFTPRHKSLDLIIATQSITNAVRQFDRDSSATIRLLDLVATYANGLKQGGVFYFDMDIMAELKARVGEGCIDVMKSYLEGKMGSLVDLRVVTLPLKSALPQNSLYWPVPNGPNAGEVKAIPTSTGAVWAVQRGKDQQSTEHEAIRVQLLANSIRFRISESNFAALKRTLFAYPSNSR